MGSSLFRSLQVGGLSAFLTGCVVVLGGSSCNLGGIQGSGVPASQERTVGDFHRVVLLGSADAVVTVGPPTSVRVQCDDNLLEHLRTEVVEGELRIWSERELRPRGPLLVEVSTPALEGLQVTGSGDIRAGGVAGERLEAAVVGSGDIRAAGEVARLEAKVIGSGNLELYDLRAREVSVKVTGSGDAQVNAVERLQAQITGSGDIRYRGSPKTDVRVTGSGEIAAERR
ncbi:MAG TPA: head GIN domain-containing protein [Planctomycetota bacterium]|nr:head GIN domain-containing protein [Planctomycetota bacterium]